MRITDRYERFTDRVGTKEAGAAKPAGTANADKASSGAGATRGEPGVLTVQVSDRAATLNASAARLEELKQQIAKGTFKVDAKAIAKSLVGGDDA